MRLSEGDVAVVTGAASGIGFALAERFLAEGLRVVIADVRSDTLASAAARLDVGAERLLAEPVDVRDPASVDALADAATDRFGRVDVVCNNAGVVGPLAPMWEQDLTAFRWVIDVALMGVAHGIRSFVPGLVRQGRGHVLNTASVGGLMPLPMLSPYNAAKSAVVALSETLRAELRQAAPAVGVSVLCPGMVPTSLSESSARNQPAGVEQARPSRDGDGRDRGVVLSPEAVAEAAVEAIAADRLHVVTHPDSAAPVRARVEALLADLPAVR